MERITLVMALLLVTPAAVYRQVETQSRQQDAKTEQEVEAAEREFLEALARSDRAALERLLADSFTVTREGDTLIGRVPLRPKFELIPKSDTEFIRHNDEGGYGDEIVFLRGADGRVTHAILRDGDQELWRAKKVK